MRYAKWVPAVFGLLLAVGVMSVFRACGAKEDGTWMRCHTVQMAVCFLGVAIALVGGGAACAPGAVFPKLLYALTAVLAVIAALLPGTLMPMCMMHTMRCYTIMQPFVRIVAFLTVVACLLQWKRRR